MKTEIFRSKNQRNLEEVSNLRNITEAQKRYNYLHSTSFDNYITSCYIKGLSYFAAVSATIVAWMGGSLEVDVSLGERLAVFLGGIAVGLPMYIIGLRSQRKEVRACAGIGMDEKGYYSIPYLVDDKSPHRFFQDRDNLTRITKEEYKHLYREAKSKLWCRSIGFPDLRGILSKLRAKARLGDE
jgi:hypothetical protein